MGCGASKVAPPEAPKDPKEELRAECDRLRAAVRDAKTKQAELDLELIAYARYLATRGKSERRMRDVSRAELLAPWRPGAARAELAKLGGSCPSLAALAPTAESDTAPIAARC